MLLFIVIVIADRYRHYNRQCQCHCSSHHHCHFHHGLTVSVPQASSRRSYLSGVSIEVRKAKTRERLGGAVSRALCAECEKREGRAWCDGNGGAKHGDQSQSVEMGCGGERY